MTSRRTFATLALLLLASPLTAAPPPPNGDPAFFVAECNGLLALRSGDNKAAITHFTDALNRTPDPRLFLARAVAEIVSGDYNAANADLAHAHIQGSRESTLWQDALWAIADIAPAGTSAGNNWFSGIPGNIVQGGDDYPTDYASAVAYGYATAMYNARRDQQNTHTPALQLAGRKAAAWFANRLLASPEMASFSYQSARQLLVKGQYAAALDANNLAKTFYPYDPDIRFLAAEAYRGLGRAETARHEYTIALTMNLDYAPAYRGRALVAAAEGDSRRAMADLASAARYDPTSKDTAPQIVMSLLAKSPPADAPATLLTKLDAAAAAGQSVEQLLPTAMALQRSHAAFSLRYDELYQDRLRTLDDAVNAAPKDPAPLVAVAAYMLQELNNRGESVEPRRGRVPFRYQYSTDLELARATDYINRALRLNPSDVAALVQSAYLLDAADQTAAAEQRIQQALAVAGANNPAAIRLLAEYRARQAGSLQARAQSLRTPTFTSSSHTENRSDGVYNVTTSYRHDPTQAELAQADNCQQRAEAIIAQARDLMDKAIKLNPDSLEGLLLQSEYQYYFGTPEASLAFLQKAVEKFPTSLKVHDALLTFYVMRNMTDQVTEEELASAKLFQTTAAPLLQRVWSGIHPNGWPAVLKMVQRARTLNPADVRSTAYLAAAQLDARNDAAALAAAKVGIALERARLQLDDQGDGARLPRDAEDFALLIRLEGFVAGIHYRAQRLDEGLADTLFAAGLTDRFAPGGLGAPMYRAMIPNPNAPELPVPTPLNGASLAAIADAAAGDFLLANKKSSEALPYFQRAAALGRSPTSGTPRVSNARGDSNFSADATGPAVAHALLMLAQIALSHNDGQTAMNYLNAAGGANPTAEQRTQINDLQMQNARLMNNANNR